MAATSLESNYCECLITPFLNKRFELFQLPNFLNIFFSEIIQHFISTIMATAYLVVIHVVCQLGDVSERNEQSLTKDDFELTFDPNTKFIPTSVFSDGTPSFISERVM